MFPQYCHVSGLYSNWMKHVYKKNMRTFLWHGALIWFHSICVLHSCNVNFTTLKNLSLAGIFLISPQSSKRSWTIHCFTTVTRIFSWKYKFGSNTKSIRKFFHKRFTLQVFFHFVSYTCLNYFKIIEAQYTMRRKIKCSLSLGVFVVRR